MLSSPDEWNDMVEEASTSSEQCLTTLQTQMSLVVRIPRRHVWYFFLLLLLLPLLSDVLTPFSLFVMFSVTSPVIPIENKK